MLVSKNIQIEFADSSMKAIDAIYDIREGVRSASLNLYSRYDVQIQTPMLYGEDKVVVEIKIPEDRVETFAIGPHLKGVANYLLKSCNGRYPTNAAFLKTDHNGLSNLRKFWRSPHHKYLPDAGSVPLSVRLSVRSMNALRNIC